MPISAPQQTKQITIATAAVSQSEPEDVSGKVAQLFKQRKNIENLGMLKIIIQIKL